MARILIDMDDVLAKTYEPWLRIISEEFKLVKYEDRSRWDPHLEFGVSEDIYKIFDRQGFFEDIPVMSGAEVIFPELWHRHDCYIVTAVSYHNPGVQDKWKWLNKHFPFVPMDRVIFTKDKSVIKADYMIDDATHNLKSFNGFRICFDHPWNRNIDFPIACRVFSWEDIRNFFQTDCLVSNLEFK